jgi:carbon-monoxide dehydrogenase medium subunit
MKPAAFEYHAPDTLDEVLALLAEHGADAKVLAGGQSLIPTMNFRLAQPAVLVDLNGVAGLSGIEESGTGLVTIGTMTRQRTAERSELVRDLCPLLHETMPHIAHPQIRNRGTVGGSVAHADPAAELPAVTLALEATLHLQGGAGRRTLPARDFFTGLFETALEPDEVLVSIEIPTQPPGAGTAFMEVSRRHGDYALVGVAAWVHLMDGACDAARVALLSVGDGPVLAASAAGILVGQAPGDQAIRAAAHAAATADIDPPGDIHASADYRRHLTSVLVRRALTVAFGRAAGGPV